MSKPDLFSAARNAGKDAPLKTQAPADKPHKKLLTIPADMVAEYERMREERKTALTFTAYIVEALREKLEADRKA